MTAACRGDATGVKTRSQVMFSRVNAIVGLFAVAALWASSGLAQQVTKETIPGIVNLARLETTVACAGATTADAVPAIKKLGFVSIINLRLATEAGAEVEKEEAAAAAAGLRYFHVPFNGMPNPEAAEKFLDAITTR